MTEYHCRGSNSAIFIFLYILMGVNSERKEFALLRANSSLSALTPFRKGCAIQGIKQGVMRFLSLIKRADKHGGYLKNHKMASLFS